MKKRILIAILVILICILGYSVYKIISSMNEYDEGTQAYDEIEKSAVSYTENFYPPDLDGVGKKEYDTNENKIPKIESDSPGALTVDHEELGLDNPDIIGWIYCPDSNINYPVLKSDDNDYYLRRMANKKYNIAGSIFMDYRNYGDFTDINTLIYGHNMKNGTMFSDLAGYSKQSYYLSHPYIYYSTDTKEYAFKVIATKEADTKDRIFSEFENADELHEYFIDNDITLFDNEIDITTVSNMVTLSTCSNDAGTLRRLVFCIPVEVVYNR